MVNNDIMILVYYTSNISFGSNVTHFNIVKVNHIYVTIHPLQEEDGKLFGIMSF